MTVSSDDTTTGATPANDAQIGGISLLEALLDKLTALFYLASLTAPPLFWFFDTFSVWACVGLFVVLNALGSSLHDMSQMLELRRLRAENKGLRSMLFSLTKSANQSPPL